MPRQWKPSEERSFFLDAEQVNTLCDQAERVFADEPTVLRLRGEHSCRLQTWRFHSHVHRALSGWQHLGKTVLAGVFYSQLWNDQAAEFSGGVHRPAPAQ